MTVREAIWRYFFGGGAEVTVNFTEVDMGLKPNDFTNIPKYHSFYDWVYSMYKKEGTLHLDTTTVRDAGGWAGHVTYALRGRLLSDEHEWGFEGYVGAFSDRFDFRLPLKITFPCTDLMV